MYDGQHDVAEFRGNFLWTTTFPTWSLIRHTLLPGGCCEGSYYDGGWRSCPDNGRTTVVDLPDEEDAYMLSELIKKMCEEKLGEENLECLMCGDRLTTQFCSKDFPE